MLKELSINHSIKDVARKLRNAKRESRNQNVGASMTIWTDELRKSAKSPIAELVDHPKSVTLDNLRTLNLPRYKYLEVGVNEFLSDPFLYFGALDTDRSLIVLNPHDNSKQRIREFNLTPRKAKNFVKRAISADNRNQYDVIVSQYFSNKYGGNIVINKDGTIYAEMVEGTHADLVSKYRVPKLTMSRTIDNHVFRYSFDDMDLRSALHRTVSCIPHDGHDYLTGYYEFLLVERYKGASLSPIFLDFFKEDAFQTK